jgi:hypothetical protein
VVGTLNTARFFGSATGPILATNLVAAAGLDTLYVVISLLTVGALAAFAMARPVRDVRSTTATVRADDGEPAQPFHKL